MESLEFQHNTHRAAIYYNFGEHNLFRIHVEATLGDLKHWMTQLNRCRHSRDQRRVTDIEYRRLLVFSDEIVLFTNMKLQNDGDV
jgi:hypothetical protein